MRQPSTGVAQDPIVTTLGRPGELQLTCSSLGARIVGLRVPVETGALDVVVGYSDQADYEHDKYYVGALCGRYAGRIGNGTFDLNGVTYSLSKSSSERHALHGGIEGFNTRPWSLVKTNSAKSLVYTLKSPDGDQGYPGDLDVRVTYTLRKNHQLVIDVEARSSSDTVVNLVSHAYFNLNASDGISRSSIDNHCVTLYANAITELDDENLPTGKITNVADTRFDLRPTPANGGQPIPRYNQPLRTHVFDQNFVLDMHEGVLKLAAVASVPEHPVALAVYTTLPGLQLYTGDYLAGALAPRTGLCFEAQRFPDSPNQPLFPSAVLKAGDIYRSRTIYAFGALDDILSIS
ncbi:MAG: aldose epimerase family protein [Gammaproteobacteria bacterium]